MISLRPSLITEHHSVSSLNDPAREASPCSRYLRPARDVDTTCTVGRNVHESMATNVSERIEPRTYSPDASVDQTDVRSGPTREHHGRSFKFTAPIRPPSECSRHASD